MAGREKRKVMKIRTAFATLAAEEVSKVRDVRVQDANEPFRGQAARSRSCLIFWAVCGDVMSFSLISAKDRMMPPVSKKRTSFTMNVHKMRFAMAPADDQTLSTDCRWQR